MISKRAISYIKAGALLLFPMVLLALPAGFFDQGQSICISKLLLDTECYGCGMTRGIMHLIHFDIEQAYAYNKLSFIVLPLLGGMWVSMLRKEISSW